MTILPFPGPAQSDQSDAPFDAKTIESLAPTCTLNAYAGCNCNCNRGISLVRSA